MTIISIRLEENYISYCADKTFSLQICILDWAKCQNLSKRDIWNLEKSQASSIPIKGPILSTFKALTFEITLGMSKISKSYFYPLCIYLKSCNTHHRTCPNSLFYLKGIPAKFQKDLRYISCFICCTNLSKLLCNSRHLPRNINCRPCHHSVQPSFQRIVLASNNQKTGVKINLKSCYNTYSFDGLYFCNRGFLRTQQRKYYDALNFNHGHDDDGYSCNHLMVSPVLSENSETKAPGQKTKKRKPNLTSEERNTQYVWHQLLHQAENRPTRVTHIRITQTLNMMLRTDEIKQKLPRNCTTPAFDFLPNIHKQTFMGRPINISNNFPTEKIATFVDDPIKEYIPCMKSYVQNTPDFKKIEQLSHWGDGCFIPVHQHPQLWGPGCSNPNTHTHISPHITDV